MLRYRQDTWINKDSRHHGYHFLKTRPCRCSHIFPSSMIFSLPSAYETYSISLIAFLRQFKFVCIFRLFSNVFPPKTVWSKASQYVSNKLRLHPSIALSKHLSSIISFIISLPWTFDLFSAAFSKITLLSVLGSPRFRPCNHMSTYSKKGITKSFSVPTLICLFNNTFCPFWKTYIAMIILLFYKLIVSCLYTWNSHAFNLVWLDQVCSSFTLEKFWFISSYKLHPLLYS